MEHAALSQLSKDDLIALLLAQEAHHAAALTTLHARIAELERRLGHLFPNAKVAREVDLCGASEHPWSVDAVVTADGKRAVFDFVTANPISVAFASAKFHDIAALDDAPTRVAVVLRKAGFGNLLPVVAQAARVVEHDAPDRAFIRAAELAMA